MTSLARQLESLAVQHTRAALAPDAKRRASLLFDPKKAANLDKEAVFALGVSGLEDLENIEPGFSEFETTLFSESSQNWERSLQTKEVNDSLDEAIESFLIKISPYFLLKSAQKTVEWLIYRYHIHYYNVDQLLMCVLPYHETNIFVRAIQLLRLDDPTNRWHWLHPIQKPGVKLARSTVVNHCRKDMGCLTFVCQLVDKFIKSHGAESHKLRNVVGFFGTTLLGALQEPKDITELMISHLLPHLLKGLKSKCLDYKAATYMLLSQLVSQVQLEDTFLAQVVPILTKNISAKLVREGLSCTIIIYQTQQFTDFKKKSMKHICRIPGVSYTLSNMGKRFQMKNFLKVFFKSLIPVALRSESGASTSSGDMGGEFLQERPAYGAVFEAMLSDIYLDPEVALFVTSMVLEHMVKLKSIFGDGKSPELLFEDKGGEILRTLERRYPVAMDSAFEALHAKLTDQEDKALLEGLTRLTMSAVKYQMVDNQQGTSLMLSLNHPNPATRVMGLQHLAQCIHDKQGVSKAFVEDSVLSRLQDDEPEVVMEVLNMDQLADLADKKKLLDGLFTVLERNWKKKTFQLQIHTQCIRLLGNMEHLPCSVDQMVIRILPHAMVSCESSMSIAKEVMSSRFFSEDERLEQYSEKWRNQEGKVKVYTPEVAEELNRFLLSAVGAMLAGHQKDSLAVLLSPLWTSVTGKETVLELLTHILQQATPVATSTPLVELSLEKLELVHKEEAAVRHKMTSASKALISQMFSQLKEVELTESGWCHLLPSGEARRELILMTGMFTLLVSTKEHANDVKAFLQNVVKKECLLPFLCFVATFHNPQCKDIIIPSKSKAAALTIMQNVLKKYGMNQEHSGIVICSILIGLRSEVLPLRAAAFNCLPHLITVLKGFQEKAKLLLLQKLTASREELLVDPSHIRQALAAYFSNLDDDSSSLMPKQKKKLKRKLSALNQLLDLMMQKDTPDVITSGLLEVLSDVISDQILLKLAPFGKTLLVKVIQGEVNSNIISAVNMLLERCDSGAASTFTADSSGVELFLLAMSAGQQVAGLPAPQAVALKQLTKMFFQSLPTTEVKQKIVSKILDVYASNESADLAQVLTNTAKQLKLDGNHVIHEFTSWNPIQTESSVKGVKRARTPKKNTTSILEQIDGLPWKRITFLLEVLQARKKMKDGGILLPSLFGIFSRILEEDKGSEESSSYEYAKQLILTILQNIVKQLMVQNCPIKQEMFPVELLVQCIRSTASPQTHQQVLLLMTTVAHLFPDYILHNVMSVFTFMGDNLLQQDDAYSLQVVTRTIQSLIPALIQIKQKNKEDCRTVDDVILNIIRIFVDARRHIPAHRSQTLFRCLLETVKVEQYLWVVLVGMVENSVVASQAAHDVLEEQPVQRPQEKDHDFMLSVCSNFTISLQVAACTKLLNYLQQLAVLPKEAVGPQTSTPAPRRKKAKTEEVIELSIIHLSSLTQPQFRLIQYSLVKLVTEILSKQDFSEEVYSLDKDNMHELVPSFRKLLKEVLHYVRTVLHQLGASDQSPGTMKFWRAVLQKAYDILDKVNILLPTQTFLEVVLSMLQDPLPAICRKALELVSVRLQQLLQHSSTELAEDETDCLLTSIDKVLTVVQRTKSGKEGDTETATIKQLALYSLKLLCRLLGASYPQKFVQVFPDVIALLKQKNQPPALVASAMLCLAELVSSLRAMAIPHLPSFMPPLLATLKDTDTLCKQDALMTCSLTTLQKIVSSLPLFLSPYLQKIVQVTTGVACHIKSEENVVAKSTPAIRLKAVNQCLSMSLSPRVLLPAIDHCYTVSIQKKWECVVPLMDILQLHISSMDKEDLSSSHSQILALFMSALEFRATKASDVPWQEVEKVEGSVIEAVLAMVVRLSEASFRPMFIKLYDWANGQGDEPRLRTITFYHLADRLAAKLKSLFNMFVGHMLQTTCTLLDNNNSMKSDVNYFADMGGDSEHKSCRLLELILDCLQKCYMYDNEGLVTKDVFTMMMTPLIDQLENFIGGDAAYEERMTNHLIPCLTQFAVAVNDDASWKTLNYQILLKTRHSSPKVRFSALKATEALTQKLGDDYMSLLPETIPFMAELMEDENEEVEALTQQVISSMEDVLGESLQKYF